MFIYQQPCKPRFYINDFEYILKTNSNILEEVSNPQQFFTLPVDLIPAQNQQLTIPYTMHNPFMMLLGHKSVSTDYAVHSEGVTQLADNIMNFNEDYLKQGWSLSALNDLTTGFTIGNIDGSTPTGEIGSIILGSYYDLSASTEFSLTMTRELDGIKKVTTKGGADLFHNKYLGGVKWGTLAPWELSGSGFNQELVKKGRRTWNLTFKMLLHDKVFPKVYNYLNYNTDSEDIDNILNDTLGESVTFFTQVLQKVGSNTPFIFNPNGGGASPNVNHNLDMMAVVKFNQNKFDFKQIASSFYQLTLKIIEVW